MNKKAFTLVELLAVIVILAIVLAIAIPRISSIIESAERSSFVSSTKLLIKAVQTKLLEDENFDITTINKSNMKTLLNIDDNNYASVSFNRDIYGKIHTNIAGEGKWNNLTTYGTYENINIKNTEIIVTDGLVLHFDAANPVSYPGSGTIWWDISGNGNNGTLLNGTIFNNLNGGSLVFDGVDDYVSLQNNIADLSGDWCINVWIKPNNDSNPRIMTLLTSLDNLSVGYMQNTFVPYIRIDNVSVSSTTALNQGQWVNIVYQITNTTRQIYINSVLTSIVSGGITANAQYSAIGGGYNYYQTNGNISNGSLYNRALTQQEIEQNFNALRERYGL